MQTDDSIHAASLRPTSQAGRSTPPTALTRFARWSTCVAVPVVMLVAGCQSAPPDPEVETAIARMTGLRGAISFRVEGAPIDEEGVAAESQLTLVDAVSRAVTTDPGLQAALARVRMAVADAEQARLLPNPVLDFAFRFGDAQPKIDAALAAPIVKLLQRPHQTAAADKRLRQSAADAIAAALDVLAEVQSSYAEAQANDALLPLLTGRLGLMRQLVDLAEMRARAGEGSPADVGVLVAQRTGIEVDLAAAQLDRRASRLHLARLVGEPSSAADWPLEPWAPQALPASLDEARCIQIGLAQRPEVQSASWHLAALGDDHAVAGLEPWSDATLGVSAQRDNIWTAGPALSSPIPLFDTGEARHAHVVAEQIEARHELTDARRKVVESVRVAWAAVEGNRANLERVRNDLIPLQRRRREQAEYAYRAGHTDLTGFLLAEQDLREAETKAIETERKITIATVNLHRAVGGPGALTIDNPTTAAAEAGDSRPNK